MGRSPVLIAVLAGGTLVSATAAQPQGPEPEGPVVVGARKEGWKAFDLMKFDASFEFLGQYRNDRLRQANGSTLEERETLMRETLDLSTEAAIGHRNFIDLFGNAKFGFDNRTLRGNTVSPESTEWNFLNLYDVQALMLGSGPAPTTVYSRREQSLIDQSFGGRIEQTVEESGVIAQLRSEVAPTTLQYFHRRLTFDGAFDQGDAATTQDSLTGQSAIRLSQNQRLDIAYTFDQVEEEQIGVYTDSFDRHDANIVHTLEFGPELRSHELRSSLRIYDQDGRSDQKDTRLDELLVLRHTDRLETRYAATVNEQSRAGLEQQFYRGQASIRHRLFDSLISSASVGADRLTAPDDFTSDGVYATGQFDYTKAVPFGRLNASAGIAYNSQDNSARGSPLAITNETHVFNDPMPITLTRNNIVPGTVVLLPPAGFPPYREGIDYTVQYFSDRAEITILPGSAIQDGQAVLADYTIGPEAANQVDTVGTSTSARYTLTEGALRGLSTFVTYRTVDQQLDATDTSLFVLEDQRDLLLGVQYVRMGLDLKYEHEEHSSDVNPFDSDRFQAQFRQPLGRDSMVSLDLAHETYDYPLEANRIDYDRITGRWVHRLSPTFDFNVRLEYRNERDRVQGDSEGFDQNIGFTWRKAQTTIYLSFQNSLLDGENSERTSQLFQVGFRRDF